MELNLTDKVAVITGGSKGIGLAVAEAFGREGARVVVGSRTETPELAALSERFDVAFRSVDLADADGADALIQEAAGRHGRIDVLVNNVGATSPRSSFLDVDDAAWVRALNMTFLSTVRASRAALPHLLAHGEGAIVNISSINARLPFPMVVDYSAAKAALSNLTKALSEEFAPAVSASTPSLPAPCAPVLDRPRRLRRYRRGRYGRYGEGGLGRGRAPADGHLHRTDHRTSGGGRPRCLPGLPACRQYHRCRIRH